MVLSFLGNDLDRVRVTPLNWGPRITAPAVD